MLIKARSNNPRIINLNTLVETLVFFNTRRLQIIYTYQEVSGRRHKATASKLQKYKGCVNGEFTIQAAPHIQANKTINPAFQLNLLEKLRFKSRQNSIKTSKK
jgi:hypothetical protein